ncbi:MAG: Rrf2 family transcriptional regulator [Candidatus Methylomirabilales bacterium]
MPLLNSSASAMAIRAALFLALQPPGTLSPVRTVSAQTGLPEPYLAKIVRQLAAAGLIHAHRGPGGGVALRLSPSEISLGALLRAIEGPDGETECALGLQACSDDHPCPIHHRWAPLRAEMKRLLQETTLATLLEGVTPQQEFRDQAWTRVRTAPSRRTSPRSDRGGRASRAPGRSRTSDGKSKP